MLCMLKHVRGVKGQNNLQHLQHRYYLMVWLESPKSQLSKTFCGLKICWLLRKLWVKMCVCSFDTFDMHSLTAPIVFIELLLTPLTWVTLLCIESSLATFDTSDMSKITLYCIYCCVKATNTTFDTSDIHSLWSFIGSTVQCFTTQTLFINSTTF